MPDLCTELTPSATSQSTTALWARANDRYAGHWHTSRCAPAFADARPTQGAGGRGNPPLFRLSHRQFNPGRGAAGVWLSHERLGYNYRMDELSAALRVVPMSCIEEIIAKRERVAAMYAERLAKVPGLRLQDVAVVCGA
ncbi:MAG: DegT/DnrJ/EryC1/StrS family aminotransferase [Firmicutes bacterium]|nr:DegT/DnrJ/EryC1/StrS family aminotransferase [Bacillota bacterium]